MFGEEAVEEAAEERPANRPKEADKGQQECKAGHNKRLAEIREDIGGQGGDAVDDHLHVHELQQHTVQEARAPLPFLEAGGAAQRPPREPEHVGRAEHQHERPDPREKGVERAAEHPTEQHQHRKPRPDSEIEGEAAAKAEPSRVGHRQDRVGAGRKGGDEDIGQKRCRMEHGG